MRIRCFMVAGVQSRRSIGPTFAVRSAERRRCVGSLTAGVVALLSAAGRGRRQGVPADQDLRLVQAVKAAEQARAIALLDGGADPNQRSADGTTALHWAVRNNDATLVDRLLRAGADAASGEPVRDHADRARLRERKRGHRRAPPQGRRQRQCHGPLRRDGAAHLRARGKHRRRARAHRRRRVRRSRRQLAGPDAAHVGCGGAPPRDDAGADRGGRRRRCPLDDHRVGAAAHGRAARQVAAAGRMDAAPAGGARELRHVRGRAGGGRRGPEHRGSGTAHGADRRADQRAFRRGGPPDRSRRRPQHAGRRRPDGALGGRRRAHDAGLEPPATHGDGRQADRLGHRRRSW